ncbi:MAG TPA: antibiotic biosynthesis monooxygenase [Planctomycetaceae bacterium]|nr:antibiotic biosynthesis monooxygenase [Planctomycetaceae bacterium]
MNCFRHTKQKAVVMIGGVKHVVVNEGQEENFCELFRTLKAEMTKHEPGTVYFDLYRSRKAARTYVVMERYRDEAAFQSHQTSAYGRPLFQQMRAIIAIETEHYDSVD